MSQEKSTIWQINDVSLEYDFEDIESVERYEKAFEAMLVDEKNLKKDGSISKLMMDYCDMYWHLFDRLFGEGTANKIFNGRKNVRICDEVYESFIQFAKEEIAKSNARRNAIMTNISVNRKERRQVQKSKK